MAQRVKSGWPVRCARSLRAMARLTIASCLPRFGQAEETRSGPMSTRHLIGDLGQRRVALALVLEAVFQHENGVDFVAPCADQLCAGLDAKNGPRSFGSVTIFQPTYERGQLAPDDR